MKEKEYVPKREDIERRAYELYLESGKQEGHAVEHWLAAERRLLDELESSNNEDAVDEASRESFPASDSPGWIGEKSRKAAGQSK